MSFVNHLSFISSSNDISIMCEYINKCNNDWKYFIMLEKERERGEGEGKELKQFLK